MDLFSGEKDLASSVKDSHKEPLASRLRPQTLEELLGQSHILGPGKLLRRAILADQLTSLIFYGPPGTGKTTLAKIIAKTTAADFFAINAVLAGVKDIREAIQKAETGKKQGGRKSILFVDEVHRFNKSQQDALLPHVENGTLTLIGATTENPFFEVNKALLSRSRVFQLRSLENEDIKDLLTRALRDEKRGYGQHPLEIEEEALEHIAKSSQGDARAALNALELMVEPLLKQNLPLKVGVKDAEESIQKKAVLYDKDGDAHYDSISAFIKSLRGSDPDASLHWMAKMIYAGEDPRFIFRRMLILASEDVGLADPQALTVVISAAQAFDYVGLPEGQFHLAQACLYLANAPKSNSSLSYFDALSDIARGGRSEVPHHLKDASRDGEDLGHGQGYKYPHAYKDHWVAQQYLPGNLQGKVYYEPSNSGFEKKLGENLQRRRELQISALLDEDNIVNTKLKGTTLKDYWVRRSLNSNSEWMGELRQAVLQYLNPERQDLLLDISGYKGFLSWEALRWVPQGGLYSVCYTVDQARTLKDWTSHFKFENQPQVILYEKGELSKALSEAGESPVFDGVIGFHPEEDSLHFLEEFLNKDSKKHRRNPICLCLAEFNEAAYHPLWKMLQESGMYPSEELENLSERENQFRRENSKIIFPINIENIEPEVAPITVNGKKVINKKWVEELFSENVTGGLGRTFLHSLNSSERESLKLSLWEWAGRKPEIPWTQGFYLFKYNIGAEL